MKPTKKGGGFSLARMFLILGVLGSLARFASASIFVPGGTNTAVYTPLESWSFSNTNYWTSDHGRAPVSFTNLTASNLGNGTTLVVNSTNPASLQFNVLETNGATNLTLEVGSVAFWFAPNWSSASLGGAGPGEWGRLLEVGGYTPEASSGWWSLFVDDTGENLYFAAQTNDFSSNVVTYVATPIAWTTNFWHFIALTYSTTNTALYLDGVLATNGPPITNYPGVSAQAGGFFIGSDSNGVLQAQGMVDDLATYNVPLDADTVRSVFTYNSFFYYANPFNRPQLSSAGSNPATGGGTPDVITGAGYLQWVSAAGACVSSTNQVWITNVTATVAGTGIINVTFTIGGGQDGYAYDVFAIGALTSPISSGQWSWMGQGYHCNVYTLPITNSANAFLILGTPQDTDQDGLTDTYEKLVSKTDPTNAFSNMDGITDGWDVLLGLNPHNGNLTDSTKRANYGYTAADWLNGVTGIKSGSITNDPEGNVIQVSQ